MASTTGTTGRSTQPDRRARASVRQFGIVRKLDDLMAPHLTMIAALFAVLSLATALIALIKITPQELYRILPF